MDHIADEELHWDKDILGEGFSAATLSLGRDPDGEGEAVATLVRADAPTAPAPEGKAAKKPAVLWIHGMTDYFFHKHVAERFTAQGYAFYALDLRKCGRSHREGQHWHYTSDLRHYYPELTAAARFLSAQHGGVIPLAHSTGGLVTVLWLDHLRSTDPTLLRSVPAAILNSPWLDMPFPKAVVAATKALTSTIGKVRPLLSLPQKEISAYGQSLHRSMGGEWDYDTTFKPLGGHRKYYGWIEAIFAGQAAACSQRRLPMPLLTLCSAKSWLGHEYSAASDSADTVLDVEQIQRLAPALAEDSTVIPLDSARHDVFLSTPMVREEAFEVTLSWLDESLNQARK
ncbi:MULTISPECIES: alpha/beta hydrolase [unclassified Corynebacterium]|uniref:alpha/beta hydrolase n=1 Tax=unclassified Corynebacterium TaxID=2624378 RepID=UPI0029CA68E3|nr:MULTISPECIES: alpha/beta hydrolase [unclassified Corynebacterium]WPF65310.1 alpha/beta hydrolase [Corynebacterium sp. 22KM0430]WPF67805.1 alpha/beta hydrolase [Corynebacterium sp. 21KM1197]